MNRFLRKLALPVCFALLAGVACGGGDDDKDSKGAEGGGAKEDIKIGAIFDLSGATADVGTPYSEGIRDYVEYRNGDGRRRGPQARPHLAGLRLQGAPGRAALPAVRLPGRQGVHGLGHG